MSDGHAGRRVSKACDRCHSLRARCNTGDPCARCSQAFAACTYDRQSRRRGRIPRGVVRPAAPIREAQGVNTAHEAPAENPVYAPEAYTGNENPIDMAVSQRGPFTMLPAQPNPTTLPGPYIGLPEWMIDDWIGDLTSQAIGTDRQSHQLGQLAPQTERQPTHLASPALVQPPTVNGSQHLTPTSAPRLKYPVLEPLMPHLQAHISSAVACDLLDSYFANHADGSSLSASRILLAHIFRRESFLPQSSNPRICTPALLSSILLISAVTTETPFFGASPTARKRLLHRLFNITLSLVRQPGSCEAPNHTSSGRHRYLDEVVTYMHLALASSETDTSSLASVWWHTAFQLAKEYRLNADVSRRYPRSRPGGSQNEGTDTLSTWNVLSNEQQSEQDAAVDSVIDIEGAIVIDRGDYRFVNASTEEMEERRRVWWMLYIWDKQVALSHNAPVALTDLDCPESLVPIDEELWQSPQFLQRDDFELAEEKNKSTLFAFLIPFSHTLELMIENHRAALRLHENGPNAELLPLFQTMERALASLSDTYATSGATQPQAKLESERQWIAYRGFFCRVLRVISGTSWDITLALRGCTIGDLSSPPPSDDNEGGTKRLIALANSLREVLLVDPHMSFSNLFCDVFIFLGAAAVHVKLMHLGQSSPPELVLASETFTRALESSISTSALEHQRKMRRLLLISRAGAKGTKDLSESDLVLQQHIIRTYRWSNGGQGLRG